MEEGRLAQLNRIINLASVNGFRNMKRQFILTSGGDINNDKYKGLNLVDDVIASPEEASTLTPIAQPQTPQTVQTPQPAQPQTAQTAQPAQSKPPFSFWRR